MQPSSNQRESKPINQRMSSTPTFLTNADELLALIQPHSSTCQCTLKTCQGWRNLSDADWPKSQLHCVGTLRDPDIHEATFEEFHTNGTRHDSDMAAISIKYFPHNRCDIYRCQRCQQHVMRYTEFGGYYVDPRARLLNPDLIIHD